MSSSSSSCLHAIRLQGPVLSGALSLLCDLPSFEGVSWRWSPNSGGGYIIGPEWTCLELEKLDTEIQVSPDKMLSSSFEIMDRIQHVSRHLQHTPPETKVLKKKHFWRSVQKQVHVRLARLRNFKQINFGLRYVTDASATLFERYSLSALKRQRIKRALHFLQDSWFDLVASLPNLRMIELRRYCKS